jgi:hypothetical protein
LRKHLAVLAEQAPEILPSYRVLAQRTAARAEESGLLKPDAANDVRTTLED